ncbi:MAG: ATP-dependent helicase [Gemmatimonadota bacterium]|nr:MAG: ATP-dependent helicase [Gemmatimonadota bacterium]
MRLPFVVPRVGYLSFLAAAAGAAGVTLMLSPHQREAALASDSHLLVTAGAGSGKTRTVVARVLYLLGVEVAGRRIADPVELTRIAAITFTNRAAAELRLQLRQALREAGRREEAYQVDTARVGTIHAFCGDVLREFGLRRGHNPNPRVLEEGEGLTVVAAVVREVLLEVLQHPTVPGVERLLAQRPPSVVRGMVERLLDESDRLRAIATREDLGEHERILVDLALRSLATLESRLNNEGVVDFDRMIVWTRDLLRDDDYVRHTLQRRIHTLIVDEFQDVDPAQREIAYLLGEPSTGRAGTTRLFLVGDAKQSIYRFRRADVSVWRAVEREFRSFEGAGVVPLPENFRSTAPIIDFVDATVGRLLDTPLDGERHTDYEVPFEALTVGNDAEQSAGPPVELIVVPLNDEGKDHAADELRLIEADAVARRASELNDAGVNWCDMAVLLAGWGDVDKYRQALERHGAPACILRSEGFYERQEVLDLVVALTAVHQPFDDRALFGFLRGPCVGLKDESLFGIAAALGVTPYWRRLACGEGYDLLAAGERRRAEWGVNLLERHIELRDRLSTDRLIESLVGESGYIAHLALMGSDKIQQIANVRKLVRIARSVRTRGLGDFLQMITDARERGERLGDAPLYGQRDDVVTITSIHSAKGLEWPVVFWCDTIRMRTPHMVPDPLRGRDRVVLRNPDVEHARDESETWNELRREIEREEAAEDRRLWYVAMTRAKQRLIVAGLPAGKTEKYKTDTPAGNLWSVLPEFELEDGATFTYQASTGGEHTGLVWIADPAAVAIAMERPEVAEPGPIQDQRALANLRQPSPIAAGSARHSATELLEHARCERRHWFKYVMGMREPRIERERDAEFIAAVKRGQIVHDVLEHLRQEDELDRLLEDAIGRWDEEAPPPESPEGSRYRGHLRTEIASVATHPDYRAVADAATAERELGFLHVADQEHFYQGKIDLVAVEVGGYALLDVKTGECEEKDVHRKAEQYAPQRDVYVASTEGISSGKVGRFAFQFSRADMHLSQPITDEDREAIAGTLAGRLERIAKDAPLLTRHPWECRWCGYRKVGWCDGVELAAGLETGGQLELGLG